MRITAGLFKSPRQNHNSRSPAPALFHCPLHGRTFDDEAVWSSSGAHKISDLEVRGRCNGSSLKKVFVDPSATVSLAVVSSSYVIC